MKYETILEDLKDTTDFQHFVFKPLKAATDSKHPMPPADIANPARAFGRGRPLSTMAAADGSITGGRKARFPASQLGMYGFASTVGGWLGGQTTVRPQVSGGTGGAWGKRFSSTPVIGPKVADWYLPATRMLARGLLKVALRK